MNTVNNRRLLVQRLRAALQPLEGTMAEAWVRTYPDGTIWAGPKDVRSVATRTQVKEALEQAGFRCECIGTRGTAGEYIVDVYVQ